MNGQILTISPDLVQKIGGMVILPLKEYEKLRQKAAEVFSLKGKRAQELDLLVRDGETEYKAGRCKTIQSLADLD
ncbi:hypothetical protein COX24_02200 [bacterium (Candidatus Gribaldobacteria) CG23_combo_of_CG06-09_8_20_14_all_37_87_8]|uniref:Uncharacterized protein n=1 Tax=bacterium (Candidatus Gribaldobacteria) CG23_combo_of_CG06-09_8_20_14_all_37_87_8 TaxID=2014278 RepID=A0A2G9ZEV2_9BACT|nr:MAG: hypothetical protein COX24_02200 [bacterium (Candidatus Gribaldobacteria) CG23_combo_of_CG06-09_8_20_14_all_37_87_8]